MVLDTRGGFPERMQPGLHQFLWRYAAGISGGVKRCDYCPVGMTNWDGEGGNPIIKLIDDSNVAGPPNLNEDFLQCTPGYHRRTGELAQICGREVGIALCTV